VECFCRYTDYLDAKYSDVTNHPIHRAEPSIHEKLLPFTPDLLWLAYIFLYCKTFLANLPTDTYQYYFKKHTHGGYASFVILMHSYRALLLITLTFICWHQNANGQGSTLLIDSSTVHSEKLDIRKYILFYPDLSSSKSFEEIYADTTFIDFRNLQKTTFASGTSWTRITVKNISNDTLDMIYFLGYHTIKEMHISIGNLVNPAEMSAPRELFDYKDQFTASLHILPMQQATYWLKSSPFLFPREFKPILFSRSGYRSYKRQHTDGSMYNFGFRTMIMGLCFLLGLFAFIQSLYGKDRTYAYWGLYLWSNFAYFFTGLDRHFNLGILSESGKPWIIVSQFPIQMSYLLFISSFLMISKYDRRIFRAIQITILALFCGFILSFYAVWNNNSDLRNLTEEFTFATDFVILLIFVTIVKKGVPQTRLLMIGSIGILTAAIIAAMIDQFDLMQFDVFWFYPVNIFSLGVCFELVFFTLALSERTEKIKIENQQLQANYTRKLEADLAERVRLIQSQSHLLEEQRVQNLTQEFEQRIAQTEIASLRSQMNPHFIFNCLNSIKLYMLENNAEAASDYLTKFSLLIRSVLDNSRSEKISLEKELETLGLYAKLEVMRFKEKVEFILNVDSDIDLYFVQIPPLLLQPFVENAIWHGLMHQDLGGTVRVEITQPKASLLHVEITDNGIGRQMSERLKSKNATLNKSYGMKVTGERIDLVNQLYRIDTKYQVQDLYDKNGKPQGTTVILEIPI